MGNDLLVCIVLALGLCGAALCQPGATRPVEGGTWWDAPDRAAKVAALIPGRKLPAQTAATLFADWTRQQAERWQAAHPESSPAADWDAHVAAAPTDAEIRAEFPRHIAPLARVKSGKVDPSKPNAALYSYCPFCGSYSFSALVDAANEYHATTNCCKTDLWGREQDAPAGYALKPNATAQFLHLDETVQEVPCTLYTDKDGVEWELFIRTFFDQKRWLRLGCDLVRAYGKKFEETADPQYVHKIAVILDQVADTYYGLPLCDHNELANGKDGKPLTRAEWEAVPRPAIFEVSYLGGWSRRLPGGSRGWLNMMDEHIWVEPYARVHLHPAFRYYSEKTYGDPDALDRKITQKLLRELSLMFKSVFSQKLLTNYQEANYVDMWMLGVLLGDEELLDFAGPAQEVAMYNHTYQDGLNGEGAPNYMAMPGGYFYPFLRDPNGWLQFYPKFLEDHPFYWAADAELRKLGTVRGVQVEFGDQHEHAFPPNFVSDPERVRESEKIGSRNWPGYGVGILRVGGPGHRQEACLAYTRASLHNAQDALSLECWVDGVPVLRRGGYAAHWCNARLQWERPEFAALKKMDYPFEMQEGPQGFDSWTWVYAHSALSQNGTIVDQVGTGKGWGDNRGYGEVITFKGGEEAGAPGSGFQVLDVKDHYSWSRVGVRAPEFRRTLIGVEGPDGRPYILDLTKLVAGEEQALLNSAWGVRAEANLPPVKETADDLAAVLQTRDGVDENVDYRAYKQVKDVERLGQPGDSWDVTWKTDIAAFAPRDPNDGSFKRPVPEDVGKVRLRMLGLDLDADNTELISAKGPWIGWVRQPLPGGARVDGNVAFLGARDFVIERRTAENAPLESLYVHVLEGFREGEESAITSARLLNAESIEGNERDIVALELEMTGGHTDTVIYQSEPGRIRLPGGVETDARYALLRTDAEGEISTAEVCRGTILSAPGLETTMPGDFTGEIVDVVGDLTGTRQQSALIVKPDKPWPAGDNLHDRQLLITFESTLRDPCNEGYRLDKVTELPGGLVRVDVQDHAPFVTSWHQVTEMPEDRPGVIRTWRPMVDHGNGPWYNGLKVWFPERDRTYTIRRVNEVGGGYGGDTLELVEEVDLRSEGIQLGDWYVIYGVWPGLRVTVANDLTWRKEPAVGWEQHGLRGTGAVTVRARGTAGSLALRSGEGTWQDAPQGRQSFTPAELGSGGVTIISGKPDWLNLNDAGAPAVAEIALDGTPVTVEAAKDLGWIDPPGKLRVVLKDADNALEPGSVDVRINGRDTTGAAGIAQAMMSGDARRLTVEVDLAAALASEMHRPRRHQIEVSVADRSVERHRATLSISFINKVPLETGVTYLSDLKALSSFAHGGLIRDRDYVGNPAEIAGRIYPKCITLCPEPSPDGTYGRVVYQVPEGLGNAKLLAEVGISDSSRGNGSATFQVQVGDSADGPWRTMFTSPTLRGGGDPVSVEVPLAGAKFLRLYTTDAGDGINSDHAVWGSARLK